MMRRLLVLTILLAGTWSSVQAATYFVKPTGADANSGLSEALAWQHVQKACSTMVAGDTVFIRAGTYDEESSLSLHVQAGNKGLTPHNSGTAGNEIVFKGYPGDALPVIKGDTTLGSGRMVADLTVKSYIVYDSLRFVYSSCGFNLNTTDHVTIRYCVIDSIKYNIQNNGGVTSRDLGNITGKPTNITVEYCSFSVVGQDPNWWNDQASGIHLYPIGNLIVRYCTFSNTFAGINLKQGYGPGPSSDSTCTGCATTASDTSQNIEIYNNTFSHHYEAIRLGGAGPFYHVTIHHNVFRDLQHTVYQGYAIGDVAGNSTWCYNFRYAWIYNNTIECAGFASGIRFKRGLFDSVSIFNNIIYNPAKTGDYVAGIASKNENGCAGTIPSRIYEDYNMFYGRADSVYYHWGSTTYHPTAWRAATPTGLIAGNGDNSLVANPLFTDTTAHNYTLQAGSPALTGGRGGAWPTYFGAFGDTTSTPVVKRIMRRK